MEKLRYILIVVLSGLTTLTGLAQLNNLSTTVVDNERVVISAGTEEHTIQWQDSVKGGTWTDISGENDTNIYVSGTKRASYRAKLTNQECEVYTSYFTIDVPEGYYFCSPELHAEFPALRKNTFYKDGEPLNIYGVNWFGIGIQPGNDPHGLWEIGYDDLLKIIRSGGFNTIRLVYDGYVMRDERKGDTPIDVSNISYNLGANSELEGLTAYQMVHKVVQKCQELGLYVLMDNHDIGLHGWWFEEGNTTDMTEDEYIEDLKFVAQNFNHYDNIIGIDLINEPYNGSWGTGHPSDFRVFSAKAGKEILKLAPDWMIFIEGNQWTGIEHIDNAGQLEENGNNQFSWGENLAAAKEYPVDLPTHKIVFAPHSYPQNKSYVNVGNVDNFPDILPGAFDFVWGHLSPDYAVMLGEFGAEFHSEPGDPDLEEEPWMRTLIQYMSEKKMPGFFYWSINENDPGLGLLHNYWRSYKTDKLEALQILMGIKRDTIGSGGGTIYSPRDGVTYTFGSGVFGEDAEITHMAKYSYQTDIPDVPFDLRSIFHEFSIEALDDNTIGKAFTVKVEYTDDELGNVDESSLRFYKYNSDNEVWEELSGATHSAAGNYIEIDIDEYGIYAVLGE